MSTPSTLAYLDAGSGAAIAAVIASGAVGMRALAGSTANKFRRRRSGEAAEAGSGATAPAAETTGR